MLIVPIKKISSFLAVMMISLFVVACAPPENMEYEEENPHQQEEFQQDDFNEMDDF